MKRDKGFTLFEVIVILILIAISGAIVLFRTFSLDSYAVVSEADTVKGHLRYAQLRAMADTVPWGVAFSTASYTLQRDGAATSDLPNENSPTHTLPAGVSISSGGGTTITFDEYGSPGTTTQSVTLASGTESHAVTVIQNTGFIQ